MTASFPAPRTRLERLGAIKVMRQVDEIVWLLEDTPLFVAGRIRAATERYIRAIVPPMLADLIRCDDVHE